MPLTNPNQPPTARAADLAARLRQRAVARQEPRPDGRTLRTLQAGQHGRVAAIAAGLDGSTARRLFDLGITPGTHVQVIRRAPFGGPMILRVADYEIAVRRQLAEAVLLADDPATGPATEETTR